MKRLSFAVSVALLISLALAGTVAARPTSGLRNIQDFAAAYFHQEIGCEDYFLSVVFVAGNNLQGPIGSGKPGSWSDVTVELQVYDCDGDPVYVLSGFTPCDPNIVRFESARVDGVLVSLWDATHSVNIDVVVDLAWIGTGDTMVRIDHQADRGYYRQERFRSAEISGTVQDPIPDGISFTTADEHSGTIGTASEVSLP